MPGVRFSPEQKAKAVRLVAEDDFRALRGGAYAGASRYGVGGHRDRGPSGTSGCSNSRRRGSSVTRRGESATPPGGRYTQLDDAEGVADIVEAAQVGSVAAGRRRGRPPTAVTSGAARCAQRSSRSL